MVLAAEAEGPSDSHTVFSSDQPRQSVRLSPTWGRRADAIPLHQDLFFPKSSPIGRAVHLKWMSGMR